MKEVGQSQHCLEALGRLTDIRPCCAWPECERSPDVRVEAQGKAPPGLPWQDRRIYLCNDHAARLAILAGPDFLLSIRQLPTS